jgi:SAM-dependent methyltransferase
MASQIAAERGARVSGLDAAGNLLAIARERVPDGDLHVGELESLPFADHSFDLVTGFNSFQFAGNPGVALAEARRVAKPGAYVVIVTWGRPEGMEAASLLAALRPLLPPPPPGAPGPFALSDENALRAFATAAGLDPAEVFDVDSPLAVSRSRCCAPRTALFGRCGASDRKPRRGSRRFGSLARAPALPTSEWQLHDRRPLPLSACSRLIRPGRCRRGR